jgi:hypothetical protein
MHSEMTGYINFNPNRCPEFLKNGGCTESALLVEAGCVVAGAAILRRVRLGRRVIVQELIQE